MKCGAHHVHNGDTQVENGYVMGYKKRQVGYRKCAHAILPGDECGIAPAIFVKFIGFKLQNGDNRGVQH
jgi:hypothetical protein